MPLVRVNNRLKYDGIHEPGDLVPLPQDVIDALPAGTVELTSPPASPPEPTPETAPVAAPAPPAGRGRARTLVVKPVDVPVAAPVAVPAPEPATPTDDTATG